MFLVIGLVLLILWLVGFALFRAVAGGFIHLLLILAIIAIVWHVVSGRNRGPAATTSLAPGGSYAGHARTA